MLFRRVASSLRWKLGSRGNGPRSGIRCGYGSSEHGACSRWTRGRSVICWHPCPGSGSEAPSNEALRSSPLRTDVGLRRRANEDRLRGGRPRSGFYLVADGMGGHTAGSGREPIWLPRAPSQPFETLRRGRKRVSRRSSVSAVAWPPTVDDLRQPPRRSPHLAGMGTTLVAVLAGRVIASPWRTWATAGPTWSAPRKHPAADGRPLVGG